MNQVYLEGVVAGIPRLINKENGTAHMKTSLAVTHRSKVGKKQEYYPVEAWNQAAQFGAQHLTPGARVLVEGYLTQRLGPEGVQMQITAARFFLLNGSAQAAKKDLPEQPETEEVL